MHSANLQTQLVLQEEEGFQPPLDPTASFAIGIIIFQPICQLGRPAGVGEAASNWIPQKAPSLASLSFIPWPTVRRLLVLARRGSAAKGHTVDMLNIGSSSSIKPPPYFVA